MERINEKGFTFVEYTLTMVLMSIFVLATGYLLVPGLTAYTTITERNSAVQNARHGLLRIQKELELLKDTQTAQPDRIVFTDSFGNPVEFRLTGTTLFRGNDILAENVKSLLFTYYNDQGNVTPAAPQVRRIHVDLSVQSQTAVAPGLPVPTFDLRTDIFPREYIYENFQ